MAASEGKDESTMGEIEAQRVVVVMEETLEKLAFLDR